MKSTIKKMSVLALTAAVIGIAGCKKDLLNVPNENQPDIKKVLANASDVEKLAAGAFNSYFQAEASASGVTPMLAVAADNITCSYGNFGMRDVSWEPRDQAWNNTTAYAYAANTKYSYDKAYSAIGSANSVLKAIAGGLKIGTDGADNNRALAVARMIQGISYGYLALVFDKVHIIDDVVETLDAKVSTTSPYKDVATAAVGYLDKAITLAGSGSFTIPKDWLGAPADISSATFIKLCNTLAARILSYTPRNKTELAAVNWAKVKTYADNGLTADWVIQQQDWSTTKWYYEAADYLTFAGWGQTDMYVVHLMDPTEPQHWDDSPTFPYPPKSTNPVDQRLNTDFEFLASNGFIPSRGYYHFSNYRYSRYDALYNGAGSGPKVYIEKSENDLLRAEARAYTGDLAGAAAIINAGTRTTRGGMPNVASDNLDAIVKAIHHERHVELYTTGAGLQFFEMRKLNLLQKGTFLHYPLPAAILDLFGEKPPFYTFGTVAKADGVGTSNGGWR
jgi:hypothetical protein